MDLTKAQRLIHKIQAFLDNGNGELSRLEKDLIKSYILQLYDAVTMEESAAQESAHQTPEQKEVKKILEEVVVKKEEPVIKKPEFTRETFTIEPGITHPVEPSYKEFIPPVKEEKHIEPEPVKEEYTWTPPPPEPKPFEYKEEPVKEYVAPPVVESVKQTNNDQQEALNKIFDQQKADELSHRFSHAPIPSIESAMGLNERIFTLNELFGGDKTLFDITCQKLNSLHSLDEARQVLLNGAALEHNWSSPDRLKMAEQFIRIVARRYHKVG